MMFPILKSESKGEEMKEKIQKIADHYGLQHQLAKSVEELIELVQAIQEYSFKLGMRDDEISTERVAEEMADVSIMLDQLQYLLECKETVDLYREVKIDRQIGRIKAEKEGE